jgi:hypothetical protein
MKLKIGAFCIKKYFAWYLKNEKGRTLMALPFVNKKY